MLLESVTFHEFGPFPHWTLDLRPYASAKLVALVAPNGTGKTTALETAFLGTCYREMETQGTLGSRARARDSYVETTFVCGSRYTVRHNVDAVSGKGTSVVKDEAGAAVYKGTSVSAFDAWAERNLPARDVLLATAFAPQAGGGFIAMGNAERISVILKALRLAKIERYAKAARERHGASKAEFEALVTRIADMRAGAPTVEEAEAALATAQSAREGAESVLRAARSDLLNLEKENEAAREALREFEIQTERRDLKTRELLGADRRRVEIEASMRGGDVTAAEMELQAAIAAEADGAAALESASSEVRTLREEIERVAALRAEFERVARQRADLEARVDAARSFIADTERRLASNRWLLDQAEQIRAAAADAARLPAEIATLEAAREVTRAESARLQASLSETLNKRQSLATKIERAKRALTDRDAVESAFASVPGLEASERATAAAVTDAEGAVSELQGQRALGADERIRGLRGGLERIIAQPSEAAATAAGAIVADDTAVATAAALPGRMVAAQNALAVARAEHVEARRKLDQANAQAARRDSLAETAAALESDVAELATEEAKHDALAVEIDAARYRASDQGATAVRLRSELDLAKAESVHAAKLEQAEGRIAELTPLLEARNTELSELLAELAAMPTLEEPPPAPDDADAERLEAEARTELETRRAALAVARERVDAARREAALIEEIRPRLEVAVADVARICAELDAMPVPVEPPGPRDPAPAMSAVEGAERTVRAAQAGVVRAEGRVDQAHDAAARTAELEEQRRQVELDLADWARLALDLGRDGIQSAEVDSAGPELTELANDLLHSCHGPRYTVSVETKRLSSDGKKEIDECRVMVIDTVDGTEKEARLHSGGEKVILEEAISLALTMMACRRAGMRDITLVRDERVGACDAQNARIYIAMLSRAVEFIGARQCLLVAHSSEVQELCDARIHLPARERGTTNVNAATKAA
jgi:exonuclease SbcC